MTNPAPTPINTFLILLNSFKICFKKGININIRPANQIIYVEYVNNPFIFGVCIYSTSSS